MRSIIRRNRQSVEQVEQIPSWVELSRLNAVEVEVLAGRLNIEYTSRIKTLQAIHKAR